MERSNLIDSQGTSARRTRIAVSRSTIIIFFIWTAIGIALSIVADSTAGVFATLLWSGVILAFGVWLLVRLWNGAA